MLAAVLLVALGACSSDDKGKDPEARANIVPPYYKNRIIDLMRNALEDPTNVRDASITEPTLKPVGAVSRYIVCIRFNAKNSSGQYAGIKEKVAYFYEGEITQIVDASREQCAGVAFQPFPDLEKLCRQIKCPS